MLHTAMYSDVANLFFPDGLALSSLISQAFSGWREISMVSGRLLGKNFFSNGWEVKGNQFRYNGVKDIGESMTNFCKIS